MLKITLASLAVLVVLGIISLAIDYYFYSLTSYFKLFGCQCNTIRVEPKNENLVQEYDLLQIGNRLRSNLHYRFHAPSEIYPYSERSLSVSREFSDVRYVIGLAKGRTADGNYTRLRFWNGHTERSKHLSYSGEAPTTPNYYIESNVNLMIDDMKLNEDQKNELR